MFKIKFPVKEKQLIKQILNITESAEYDIVLCDEVEDSEPDKINIVFQISDVDKIKEKIQFFHNSSVMMLMGETYRGKVKIPVSEIRYIESFGNEITADVSKTKILLPDKLYELSERLEPFGFIRISKSVIVNITKIEAIRSTLNGKLLLTLDETTVLEVNRSYKKAFKEYLEGR